MIAALILAAACVCRCPTPPVDWSAIDHAIEEAAKKTDRAIVLARMRKELDAILRRNRACFELAMDGRLSTKERADLLPICRLLTTEDK